MRASCHFWIAPKEESHTTDCLALSIPHIVSKPFRHISLHNYHSRTQRAKMLHRRNNSSAAGSSSAPPTASTSTPPRTNTAYQPLRRGSSNLYSTPQSGAKARYNVPSPSPGLGVNTGYLSPNGYGASSPGFGSTGAYDLTGDPLADGLGRGGGSDWMGVARTGVERFKKGLSDAGRVDRSVSLVWG